MHSGPFSPVDAGVAQEAVVWAVRGGAGPEPSPLAPMSPLQGPRAWSPPVWGHCVALWSLRRGFPSWISTRVGLQGGRRRVKGRRELGPGSPSS